MWHIDQHFKSRNEDCLQEFSSFSLVLVGHTEKKIMLNQVIILGDPRRPSILMNYVIFLLPCRVKNDNFDKTFPKRCRSFVRRRWERLPGGIHRRRNPEKTEVDISSLRVVASTVKYTKRYVTSLWIHLDASGRESLLEPSDFLIVGQFPQIGLVRPAAKGQHLHNHNHCYHRYHDNLDQTWSRVALVGQVGLQGGKLTGSVGYGTEDQSLKYRIGAWYSEYQRMYNRGV